MFILSCYKCVVGSYRSSVALGSRRISVRAAAGFQAWVAFTTMQPKGSIYTTIMELGPRNHSTDGLLGPNSILIVYMDPLGK